MTTSLRIERLGREDLPEIAALLEEVGLDVAGLEDGSVPIFGVRDSAGLEGTVAYERGGSAVLLRSLAVRRDRRGRGLGRTLEEFALAQAASEGAVEAFLLTESARDFFTLSGWHSIERGDVDRRFPASQQVLHVCPSSAAALRKPLRDGGDGLSAAGAAGDAASIRDAQSPSSGFGLDVETLAQIRRRFPALASGAVFLDGPGGTQVPDTVVVAMARYLERHNANLGGFFETSLASDRLVAEARAAAARFLGATPDQVVFGSNMTTLNFALTRALGRELRSGDEIVLTQLDHDANVAPWLHLAEDLGLVVRFARVTDAFTLDMDHVASLLGDRTRVVAFPWASNALGTVVDAPTLTRMAHAAGALAWVDAVHYAPHAPIDASALGADVVLCSPYKFFGPHLGVAVGSADLLARLRPYKVRPAAETPPGHRFETGTLPHEALAGLIAAIEYVESIGFEAIQAHEGELGRRFLAGLARLPHLRLWGVPVMEGRVPTFALTSSRETPARIAERLAAEGIYVWSGNFYAVEVVRRFQLEEGLLRAGFVHYNTADEVDRVLAAL